jgi:ankyrin repeat protein
VPYRCRAPQQGDTPLQLALFHENEEAVAKLLDAGAAGVSKDASDKVRGGVRYANRK